MIEKGVGEHRSTSTSNPVAFLATAERFVVVLQTGHVHHCPMQAICGKEGGVTRLGMHRLYALHSGIQI